MNQQFWHLPFFFVQKKLGQSRKNYLKWKRAASQGNFLCKGHVSKKPVLRQGREAFIYFILGEGFIKERKKMTAGSGSDLRK